MTLQVVHLRVNDAATGKPTAVRLRVTSGNDVYLAPLGRPAIFPTGDGVAVGGNVLVDGKAYAYIDGACEIRLPTGPLQIEASKGPEYPPVQTEVVRKQGQIALRLTIERACDLSKEGWFSGDTHAQFLSPAAAGLEGAAEGLSVVNLLADGATLSGLLDFSGQAPAFQRDDCQVVVNTLNRGGAQGDLALLNAHRVIHPLELGQEGFEQYTLADWCQQCHRKGGLVVRPNFPRGNANLPNEDIYRGGIDAVEWTGANPFTEGLAGWYSKLNQGLRLPLVGGSGKRGNATVLGSPRTYVQLEPGAPFEYRAWIEAVRLGRTFVTRGALLRFTANGIGPGRVIPRTDSATTLRLEAGLIGPCPCERIEVVRDGKPIGEVRGSEGIVLEVQRGERGWLAARGWNAGQLAVHTSPVYVG